MKRFVLLPLLALAVACSDDGILQPDAAAPPDMLAADWLPNTPANDGWHFTAVSTYTGPIDPGVLRITPGGVMLIDGVWNGFDVTGDIVGRNYWYGKVRLNLGQVKGPAIGQWVVFDLTEPAVGRFECRMNGLSINYPGPEFTLAGDLYSCHGSGAFEGMHMKGRYSNRIGTDIYDTVGVIW
jgi:hypothetical protein